MVAMGWTGDAVEVNISVSLALGSRRPGGIITPNDFRADGVHRSCKLWCLLPDILPGKGSVSTVTATLNAPSAWTLTPVTCAVTPDQADPYGGSAAYKLTESTDGGDTIHDFVGTPSNDTLAALYWHEFWVKFSGRPAIELRTNASGYRAVFGDDGTFGYESSDVTGSVVETIGDWWHIRIATDVHAAATIEWEMRPCSENTPSGRSYTGDGRDCCWIYDPRVRQVRASAWSDWSLDDSNPPQLNGHDLAQGTAAKQPMYMALAATINERAVLYREGDRACYLVNTDAGLLGVANGDDPPYAIAGVVQLTGVNASICQWVDSGTTRDIPVRVDSGGTELESYRRDGAATSTKTIGSGLGSALATPKLVVFIRNTDRTCEVWIGGVLVDTITHDDLGSAAYTDFQSGHEAVIAGEELCAELAVFAGQVPGADAAARYATLKTQAGLSAMAARHGLTA
jgi:hypothetical protein